MSDFKVIETQEQLDAVIGDRIKRERENVEKKYAGYLSPEAVNEQYKDYLSPEAANEKYKDYLSPEAAAEKDAKIKGYETSSVKMRIAHEMGLSYDAVGFLSGEDEETIKKSAETLKSLLGNSHAAPLASTDPVYSEEDKSKIQLDAAYKKMLKKL